MPRLATNNTRAKVFRFSLHSCASEKELGKNQVGLSDLHIVNGTQEFGIPLLYDGEDLQMEQGDSFWLPVRDSPGPKVKTELCAHPQAVCVVQGIGNPYNFDGELDVVPGLWKTGDDGGGLVLVKNVDVQDGVLLQTAFSRVYTSKHDNDMRFKTDSRLCQDGFKTTPPMVFWHFWC